ncbi:MBL fold metallo-hydrolase [Actinotalea sp. Marseille-Q4924]|uniref:MBL fold metallo-hydrolase n=1 Tax=Actinotalea sp. Marseille-Q4924 TaxID=2866571 RepID=UPI001CE466C8|nr:MBL fold metallo-hydrolase [Actinotalea sp. Marseille-Q4924]
MTTTTLTLHGHACARLERDGRVLVVDPGSYSDRSVLDEADAVLVTHDHADHLVAADVVAALAERPALHVWGPAPVVTLLVAEGADRGRVHEGAPGERWTAGGFEVQAFGGSHAVIHPDLPVPANLAYLVDGVLHPGDSFTVPDLPVEVLLLPVGGPWMKVAEAVDHVRAVGPRVVVPIHDAVLAEAGKGLADRLVGTLGGAPQYRRLAPGERLAVGG